jgi:hypothetical protein
MIVVCLKVLFLQLWEDFEGNHESKSYISYPPEQDSNWRIPEVAAGLLTLSYYGRYRESKKVTRRTVLKKDY